MGPRGLYIYLTRVTNDCTVEGFLKHPISESRELRKCLTFFSSLDPTFSVRSKMSKEPIR